jgi:hypothetical protein
VFHHTASGVPASLAPGYRVKILHQAAQYNEWDALFACGVPAS